MHDHLLTTFQVVAVPLSKNMGVRRDTCTVVGRPEMGSMISCGACTQHACCRAYRTVRDREAQSRRESERREYVFIETQMFYSYIIK
jgi:hypothetical protein